ncbi:MAG: hypothetical protein Q8R92_17325 [Deltaproteobacteria bacterium]|nr:hypothetical protein [Deltaproteobacteria bacterium]
MTARGTKKPARGAAGPRAKKPGARKPDAAGAPAVQDGGLLTKDDLYLFNEGSHCRLYDKFGARPITLDGKAGTQFTVWAPNARQVSVVGDWNGWNRESHPLRARELSGIWEGFVPGVGKGSIYKYHIVSRHKNFRVDKADPFGVHHETPPKTGSIVWDTAYDWGDAEWMAGRKSRQSLDAPVAIYEMHLESWRRVPEEGNR